MRGFTYSVNSKDVNSGALPRTEKLHEIKNSVLNLGLTHYIIHDLRCEK